MYIVMRMKSGLEFVHSIHAAPESALTVTKGWGGHVDIYFRILYCPFFYNNQGIAEIDDPVPPSLVNGMEIGGSDWRLLVVDAKEDNHSLKRQRESLDWEPIHKRISEAK